jgi:phage gpG-like protein
MAIRASGLIFNPRASVSARAALGIHFEPAMIISARKVDKLGLDIRSFKEPLKRSLQQVIIPGIRKQFDVEGRSPRWPALADGTVRQRGNAHPILNRTGKLRRTMGYLNIWTIDREKAYIQDLPEKIWYGKVHQSGATFSVRGGGGYNVDTAALSKYLNYRGRRLGSSKGFETSQGEIPARPFVVLYKKDEVQVQRIFNEWLGERAARAGLGSVAR